MKTIIRRAAIYCRISEDREGSGLGVTRQEEDCRKRAEQLGWHVAELYVDNDVSAYSGKPRPQWQRLIADVKSGAIDAVICWHVDRLTCAASSPTRRTRPPGTYPPNRGNTAT